MTTTTPKTFSLHILQVYRKQFKRCTLWTQCSMMKFQLNIHKRQTISSELEKSTVINKTQNDNLILFALNKKHKPASLHKCQCTI